LKQLSLAYNIPVGLIRQLKFIDGLRVYASAQNLLTITGYKGTDPEVNVHANGNYIGASATSNSPTVANTAGGLDFNSFPAYRTFIVGIKLDIH
jgi:hypothetical protein